MVAPPALRFGSVITLLIASTVTVACSSSSDDASQAPASAPASGEASWSDSKSTLGVTEWAAAPVENPADQTAQLTGYDDAHQVKSQFLVDTTKDADGNTNVRIRSMIQGPAVIEFHAVPGNKIQIVQDTFRDHPDAVKALELATANLKTQPASPTGGSLVGTQALHILDGNTPLVGNQQQLICTDSSGHACEKPPGAADTVRDCVIGAGGFAGLGCLASGAETVGIGCIVSGLAAVGGGLICANDVAQRSSCTCVTPCAAQCHQQFNRQYMCPSNNTTSCSNAVANDRMQEASCTRACPSG